MIRRRRTERRKEKIDKTGVTKKIRTTAHNLAPGLQTVLPLSDSGINVHSPIK